MWTILKVFTTFVIVLLVSYSVFFFSGEACGVLAPYQGWNLHSLH